jgi:fibronectin type 3 domain-containing protein
VSVPAASGASASIELTWAINTEPDLAGYNVYRSESADVPGQRLNNDLLSAPTFRDMSVMLGKSYFYRVGAVDQSGNESALSSIAEAQASGP